MQGGEGRVLGFSLIAPSMWGGGGVAKSRPANSNNLARGEVDIGGLFVQYTRYVLSNPGTL